MGQDSDDELEAIAKIEAEAGKAPSPTTTCDLTYKCLFIFHQHLQLNTSNQRYIFACENN
jgi:hypothetical protein